MKLKLRIVFIMLTLFMGVFVVAAGSPHFIGSLSFSFDSLHVTGDIAGLGNTEITVSLVASANVTA